MEPRAAPANRVLRGHLVQRAPGWPEQTVQPRSATAGFLYFLQEPATDFGTSTGVNGGSSAGNQNDPKSRYGPDNFIRPQRFILNYLYQFPSLSKHSSFVRQALGGWALVGVTTVQDGHRLTVLYFNG